jgi:hypothetical protein
MTGDNEAKQIIEMHGRMKAERNNFDALYQRISERILPEYGGFYQEQIHGQPKRREKIFDSTAPSALEKLASALDDMLTPRNSRWHGLETNDEEINQNREFKIWAREVTEILFAERYSARSNFASQIHECYLGLGAFGTTSIFVDDTYTGGLRYKSQHLANIWVRENNHGIIDYAHRGFEYDPQQAIDAFGEENLPNEILQAQQTSPLRKYKFIHCVKPNPDYIPGNPNPDFMKFSSIYVSETGQKVVSRGGYRTFRLPTSRYKTMPNQLYGSSPAIRVLPDIMTLNEMEKTILKQGQKSADPTLLATRDALLGQFAMVPGHINYGGLDDRGNPLIREMQTGANFPLTLEMTDRRREIINDAFLVNLFQILVETPSMTATEVMERAKEKGMLLAPTGGRQQSELLGGIIECELDILEQQGKLPPKPDILLEAEEMDDTYMVVQYTSPLNQAQRAGEGLAIQRTLEAVTPLAQIDPNVLKPYNLPKISRELADINGMDPSLMFSDEELQAMEEAQLQQQQAEQLLNAAPVVAQSAKNFAETQAISQAPSNMPLPNIIPQ